MQEWLHLDHRQGTKSTSLLKVFRSSFRPVHPRSFQSYEDSRIEMIDALLLSGGKGSRSENPGTPKSLQQLTPELRVIDTIASSLNSLDSNQLGKIIAVLGRFHEVQASAFAEIDWPAELVIANSLDSGTSHAVIEGLKVASADWPLSKSSIRWVAGVDVVSEV